MAISMTGYGRGEVTETDRRASAEIKSVNNRYCDIQIRMPRILAAMETRIREEIGLRIKRGKVDVQIGYEDTGPEACRVTCDTSLARAYAKALRQIAEAAEVPEDISAGTLGRFGDILRAEPAQIDPEAVWQMIRQALLLALEDLSMMRRMEGKRLTDDIHLRINSLESLRLQVMQRAPAMLEDYRHRLLERVRELTGDQASIVFDEQRMTSEIALFADKCAIDEELVRLGSHLKQAGYVVQDDEPAGKKLDFIVQEMNREINTIGSKANDLEITNRVVMMKTELEKIREQIQNLE